MRSAISDTTHAAQASYREAADASVSRRRRHALRVKGRLLADWRQARFLIRRWLRKPTAAANQVHHHSNQESTCLIVR